RPIGPAIGLALLGPILTQRMTTSIATYLAASAVQKLPSARGGATAVFDPAQLAHLPPAIAAGIRHGLADALHPVFLALLPIIAVSILVTLLIKELPLRQTVHVAAGRQPRGAPQKVSGASGEAEDGSLT